MKDLSDINFNEWFAQREVDFLPSHFVATRTVLTQESHEWIREKLTGRYTLLAGRSFYPNDACPYFEDPEEASFYELKWG